MQIQRRRNLQTGMLGSFSLPLPNSPTKACVQSYSLSSPLIAMYRDEYEGRLCHSLLITCWSFVHLCTYECRNNSLCVLYPLQREIVVEELEHISEQYQQLSSTFAAQSEELSLVERETRETRESLALRETELATLRQKKERRASVSKVR